MDGRYLDDTPRHAAILNSTLDIRSAGGCTFHLMEQDATARTAGAVRAELARRQIKGRELAKALGWSPTTTWRRLNGTYPFDVAQLADIAAHLGVPVSTLMPDRDYAA